MPASVTRMGPGLLTIGEVGALQDVSCQIKTCQVEWEKESEDPVEVLCGESVPGSTTYSAKMTGTLLQDLAAATGFVEFSWTNKGTQFPFVFIPNNAAAKQVMGNLIVDPLKVGGEVGANADSDFDFAIVGEPTITPVTTGG